MKLKLENSNNIFASLTHYKITIALGLLYKNPFCKIADYLQQEHEPLHDVEHDLELPPLVPLDINVENCFFNRVEPQ